MGKSDQPPYHGEEQPAAQEGRGEDHDGVAPLQVDQGGENVLQEAPLLADVLVGQVASPVLGNEAGFARTVPEARLSQILSSNPRKNVFLWDNALPGQHLPVTIVHKSAENGMWWGAEKK